MRLYKVRRTWVETHSDVIEVEADSAQDAIELAWDTEVESNHLTYDDTIDSSSSIEECCGEID